MKQGIIEEMKRQWVPALNEMYAKQLMFSITESQKYENAKAFLKGFGFKIYRNSAGQHKLEYVGKD